MPKAITRRDFIYTHTPVHPYVYTHPHGVDEVRKDQEIQHTFTVRPGDCVTELVHVRTVGSGEYTYSRQGWDRRSGRL